MNAALTPRELRRLYRELLHEARRFPSTKRAGIVADLRVEWREKALVRDPGRIAQAIEVAVRGLATLRKYTSLDLRASAWSVQLEEDPLGAATHGAWAVGAASAPTPAGEVELVPHGPAVTRLR